MKNLVLAVLILLAVVLLVLAVHQYRLLQAPAVELAPFETPATSGMPATAAFWTTSNETRPDTSMILLPSGHSFGARWPTALSTALCRPMSSRIAANVPAASKTAAAWRPPVSAKATCRDAMSRIMAPSESPVTTGPSGGFLAAILTASIEAFPQTPHDELV